MKLGLILKSLNKMKRSKILNVRVLILLFYVSVFTLEDSRGQNQSNRKGLAKETVGRIKSAAVSFLSEQGYLEKSKSLDENLKQVYFAELSTESILGFYENGIYVFGVSRSHTRKYLIIESNGKWIIEDMTSLKATLLDACNFFLEQNVSDEQAALYASEIIEIFRFNGNY